MIPTIETYIPIKRLGVKEGLRAIASSGFSAVDFTFYFELEALVEQDDYLIIARDAHELMGELGLVCTQAHAPFSLCPGEERAQSERKFRNIVRSMQMASIMGAKIIVVHSPAAPTQDETEIAALRLYRALMPYCREFGIRIGVENLGNALSTPESLNRVLAQLDEKWFTACFDVGHAWMLGIAPQDFIRKIKSGRLGALHIHDNDGTDDQHQLPYWGTIDWKAVICALKEVNYAGELTFEAWRFLDSFPTELLRAALDFEACVATELAELMEKTRKENAD